MSLKSDALELHKVNQGKLSVNSKVALKDKEIKNYHVKAVEGNLISDFIQCVMNVNDTNYSDDKLTEAIQKNVMDLVNINKERNRENQELKNSINMYQTYCSTCDSKISHLKERIDKLTIENAQKDSKIRELTEKNKKFDKKLNELRAIQQSDIFEE